MRWLRQVQLSTPRNLPLMSYSKDAHPVQVHPVNNNNNCSNRNKRARVAVQRLNPVHGYLAKHCRAPATQRLFAELAMPIAAPGRITRAASQPLDS